MAVLDWLRHHAKGTRPAGELSDSPLGIVLQGSLAGFAGTLALTVVVKGAQMVAGRLQQGGGHQQGKQSGQDGGQQQASQGGQGGIGAGEALAGGQVQAPFLDQSTEIFVQKVATGLFGVSLSGGTRTAAGVAMHFSYGSFWGALYGLIQSSLHLPPALHGLLYGLIVWLIGPVILVPAMGIMPPPQRQPLRQVLMMVSFHLAYGLGLGLTFHAFTRPGRRR